MMSKAFLGFLLVITGFGSTVYASVAPHLPPEYTMSYEQALEQSRALSAQGFSAEAVELVEIVRQGGRAVQWMDTLQRDVPESQREQIWRRADRLGHEATPEAPMVYNPTSITQLFTEAEALIQPSVLALIKGQDELPGILPDGLTVSEVIIGIRKIHTAYSRASRWLALLQWRTTLGRVGRDFRPLLNIRSKSAEYETLFASWGSLTTAAREAFVTEAVAACPVSGLSERSCTRAAREVVTSESGEKARTWFARIATAGDETYRERFTVNATHRSVDVTENGDEKTLTFYTSGVPEQVRTWIAEQVSIAWDVPGALRVVVKAFEGFFRFGLVKVSWETGALPHVNGIAGSTITMDANTALWLEHTQITMQHEFGHVMGFADCYTEFWDEDLQSFVFYTLDADNRMCALSGVTQPVHSQALRAAYH